jgi:peptidylprolyl isomerase
MKDLPMKRIASLLVALAACIALAAKAPNKTVALTGPAPSLTEILAVSPATDWEPLDPSQLLVMTLANSHQVVIYLAPFAAPNTVANIQTLAHEKYWDGLAIVRSQDNYVVQWGDPNAESPQAKSIGSVKPTLVPEFDMPMTTGSAGFFKLRARDAYADVVGFWKGFAAARDLKQHRQWLTHCYGAVGVGRGETADSGNGQELYVVNGHSPRHLDRNVTIVGKVISGMEFLSSLPRGTGPLGFYKKPEERLSITSVRLASDLPEASRPAFERLSTMSKTFPAVLKNRRMRRDGWFLHSPQAVDVCNVPLPFRLRKN